MEDEVLYDLGVDIDSSFTFHDGDLVLAKYDENLIQAISNRFNTELDEINYFYDEYGSLLKFFLGWRKTEETLSLIKAEVDTTLNNDLRVLEWETKVGYIEKGVKIHIRLKPFLQSDWLNMDFLLSDNGVEVL